MPPATGPPRRPREHGLSQPGRWLLGKPRNYAVATAIVTALIFYGSLYPFSFRALGDGLGSAARALIESWADRPSRSDFIANLLFYTPFGFCAVLTARKSLGRPASVLLVVVLGVMLSTAMELAQYFDDGRVTAATDLYANGAGALVGAIGGVAVGGELRWPLITQAASARIPLLLLGAWIGYRLFPYVPTIDLHKYWDALKPVILYPNLTGYDLFRYTAIWLALGALVEAVVAPGRDWLAFPVFVGAVLLSKVMIVDAELSLAELAGAGLALVARAVFAFALRFRVILAALFFLAYILAERLEPFAFAAIPGPFGWVPFYGFMAGALEIDVMSFLQKFFFYGAAIWLLAATGARLWLSTLVTAAMLFVTSEAERFLPNRSAEITDAVMALVIGAVFALLGARARGGDERHRAISPRGWRRRADWPH
jgi:VanZ family protein